MEQISLKDWAKRQNMSYSKAYRLQKSGKIPNVSVVKGDIMIGLAGEDKKELKKITGFKNKPVYYSSAGEMRYRTNNSAQSLADNNYANISNLFSPSYYSGNNENYGNFDISITDIINLTQRAYIGIAAVRRTINTLKEFSASDIYLTGGNEKSRKFYKTWFKAIKLNSFCNSFFLEFWRSYNCFIYKINGKVKDENLKDLQEMYGKQSLAAKREIPVKYVILNPASITYRGSSFYNGTGYYKMLTPQEISQLQNRDNIIDKEIYNSLPETVRQQIDSGKGIGFNGILIPLDSKNFCSVFNDKQDYESFAVSQIYTILDALEHKIELSKMDRAIAKTVQQAVLHVSMGYESKEGEYLFNEEAAEKIEEIFEGEEVGKVLITDFTTKLQFVIPQIGDLLDPKKYEIVNNDIHEGLMDILFGGGSGEKFSNLTLKIKVFVEKIKKARETFLEEFLIPEMQKIGEEMGFKSIPTPHFEDIDIEDNINFYKIVTRLAEIGILTPDEVFQAFENGRMPTAEESEEAQKKFKQQKDDELYVPLLNNGKDKEGETGRPSGSTGIPQSTKKVSPIGTKASLNLEKFTTELENQLKFKNKIASAIKKSYKLKELNQEQLELVKNLSNSIIFNEPKTNWEKDEILNSYILGKNKQTEQYNKIASLSKELNFSLETASVIFHSND